VDTQGLVVDFHGQRTTFITALASAGVSPASAQKLARHSDINLTMGTYTRLEAAELADDIGKLTGLRPTVVKDGNAPTETKAAENNASLPDPRLAGVVAAWPDLPEHIHQAIIALTGLAVINKKDGAIGRPADM
jgi:hypothetical protein